MARQTLVDDDGVVVKQLVKVSGQDELEYWRDFVNVHNNSPCTTLRQARDIAEQCKAYAEAELESNTLKKADRSVLERQLKDARNILACHWAVSLQSGKIPKRHLEPLQWAIVESFNMGRLFERLRVRPAGPHAKRGKTMHVAESKGGKARGKAYKDARGAAHEKITLIRECYGRLANRFPGKSLRFLCKKTSESLTKSKGNGFSVSTVYRTIKRSH